jgi:hypothetical protein
MTSIIRPRTVASTAVAAVLVLVLTACAPDKTPSPVVAADTSDPPPYASGDEALIAAQSSYEQFMAVANKIMAEGGADPDRLDAVASPEIASGEKEGFEGFAERKLTVGGGSTITNAVLQSYSPSSTDGKGIITAYFCVNVSGVTVVDETGVSIVPSTRPDATPFEVVFDLVQKNPPQLVVSAKNVWAGEGIC